MTYLDLSLHCPVCGLRADMCFQHGDDWKKRAPTSVHQKTEAQLRAVVNEFTEDDSPPYTVLGSCRHGVDLDREFCPKGCRV